MQNCYIIFTNIINLENPKAPYFYLLSKSFENQFAQQFGHENIEPFNQLESVPNLIHVMLI